ncbi:AAA family ATPase [Chryseobacterium aquaticum]|uniref:AAA family ATPase n=1 Tax=Chryseobacterium aquaticum TaxID=452084 RepID=A0A848N4P9_9FLAO|nr:MULTISPECIES: AAA family ATPase [Chryseobacterium]NMR35336.1 AAA family ATPase [Chryseobacterium aquaticum]NRQ47226.1 AAA family ATPase [Chryseobacterium sp. C-204]
MINIKSIEAIVLDKQKVRYGFKYDFSPGLNIISGDNSSGKSTILSCIYYCLGMEQLAATGNSDGLKECLKSSFKYEHHTILVDESHAELHLYNEKKDFAIVKRSIKSNYGEDANIFFVQVNDGDSEEKFIHAKGDSDHESGFYRWLSDFSGIDIPVFESESGTQKILYLQQIFASSFVEQTKGWSDFFAQVPIFGTKKAKQKIVEFTLGLSGLVEEFELDKLKEEEKEIKTYWSNSVDNFQSLLAYNNFSTANLPRIFTTELTPKKINKLTINTRALNDKYESIEQVILYTKTALGELQKKNSVNTSLKESNSLLLQKQIQLRTDLKFLNEEVNTLQKEKINEQSKILKYESTLEQLKREIEVLEGLQKINHLETFHVGSVKNCPVCNSSLAANPDIELQNVERVNAIKSLSFYKSERSLYESYIKSAKNLLERFDRTLLYYNERISDLRINLETIDKEIVDDSRIPSRVAINDEINYRFELNKLEKVKVQFDQFKVHLTEFAEDLLAIKERREILKSHQVQDKEIIFKFQNTFLKYLTSFGYSKEILDRIFISTDENNKLFPVVSTPGIIPQPIRLMSSASDFIRAQWAFYLSLLIKAKFHLGILVLDEPGQHAMATEDLKMLLKEAAKIKNRQVIIAISKEDKVKKEELLDGSTIEAKEIDLLTIIKDTGLIQGKDYKLNMIDGNGRKDKCIQLFK